ncbi:MAG: TRAP transporter substrate-binding protein [Deltaproteobacteria bacterium]|jgi:TRAP-type transport system periplasmic protein|nr:TRAP transporter substrate-binding protein [Deltaproteobacteria bacterium]MBT4263869.1 TRAP transporter substrate-binding protein [Deltaproteobacteria bacterium]MBT4639492.1 TRAP transporter substrate-binding protein [Deltaproteobacteria bacterium]MBT6501929.1 TRAP transporter substrate-binding protein [Deltaproteobacteria bacterium]MBT7154502.1 TRAP transporter substrate-binding protein [Deltaproteobacteria bacterium]
MRIKKLKKMTISMMVLFFVCSASTSWAKTYKFRFANAAPLALTLTKAGVWIADRLNAETNGQIEAKYYHSRQMGDEIETFNKLQKGVLQGAVISAAVSANFGPTIDIFNLPFMFPSYDALDRFLESKHYEKVLNGLKKYGITGLGQAEAGYYSLASIKPLRSFDDVSGSGMKFRVPKSKIMMAYIREMGLSPTPLPFGEVYVSLTQGVVDGLGSAPSILKLVKFDEVVKNIYLTQHWYGGNIFWVRDDFLNQLPDKLRKQFVSIVTEELARSREVKRKLDEDVLAEFRKKGIAIHHLTKADRVKFIKAMEPVYDKFDDKIGKKFVAEVRAEFQN